MSPFDWSGLSPNAVIPGSEALMAHFVANRCHTLGILALDLVHSARE
jgi:hypothetical protein